MLLYSLIYSDLIIEFKYGLGMCMVMLLGILDRVSFVWRSLV